MMDMVIGIDVSKFRFDVALLTSNGKYREKKFKQGEAGFISLLDWLGRYDVIGSHVCMEATGGLEQPLALFLHQAGMKVSVVNPALVEAYGRSELTRAKTDKQDARLIARFCYQHSPPFWTPPEPEVVTLQALVRRLDDLLGLETKEKNRRYMAMPVARASIDTVLKTVQDEIVNVRKQIKEHIDRHPEFKEKKELLETIPGIGEKTVAVLLAFLSPFERFNSSKAVVAYAGLNPKVRQSGKWRGASPIAKAGNALLRKALYFPAIVAKRYNPVIRSFYERLIAQGKRPKQAVVAAMAKLLRIAFGVLKRGTPFQANYALD